MLLELWHIIIVCFKRFFARHRSPDVGSRYERGRFDGGRQDFSSPLITGSQERGTSNSSYAVLFPKETKSIDPACFSTDVRGSKPGFLNLIEVNYVEGEFLSKSLDVPNRGSERPRTRVWFAAAFAVVLAFVGIKSNFLTHISNDRPENRIISDKRRVENSNVGIEARTEKALLEVERPAEPVNAARVKPILQQKEDLSETNMPSQNSDQIISPVTDMPSRSDVKVGPGVGSEPIGNYKASVDDFTNVSTKADHVDRSSSMSRKSSLAKHDGVSPVSKNIASSRNRKERTQPIGLARPSSGQIPETVVNGVLGGLAGAVVGGPVGLIAGATVGVTAGKAIAQSWGLR